MTTRPLLAGCLRRPLDWRRAAGSAEFPYEAMVDGLLWRIRVNDFPAEPLYTLLIADEEIGDLDDWPPSWRRPA